jgi:aminopeptidase N
VRLDPDLVLLAKINFQGPNGMLEAQLKDEADVIGRFLAVEQLGKQRNAESVRRLRDVLEKDPYWAVRVEASSALRQIHTDEALTALLDSAKQSDARVRRQVMQDITRFYRDPAYAKARDVLKSEKNPEIVSVALGGLAGYDQPEIREVLVQYLGTDSYHNRLASAAVRAMRSQDDPQYIEPLLTTLNRDRARFDSDGLEEALSTLAYLARNEDQKTPVREFLTVQLRSEKRRTRVAAIQALGKLGDPKAIGAIEKFLEAPRETREAPAAEAALAELRASRRPVDDFKNLRQEVTDLKKENRDLRNELGDLKKQFDAFKPTSAAEKKKKRNPSPLPSGKGKV